jgi:hypothetical protein
VLPSCGNYGRPCGSVVRRTRNVIYGIAADAVLVLHLSFVVFVVLGAALVFRWRWVAFVHVPAVIWGVCAELFSIVCPLTPLENVLRRLAGEPGYSGSFIERYLVPVLYPAELTAELQLWLGAFVVIVNTALYAWLIMRSRARRP